MIRVGIGYDSHRFERGRKLIIGGVEIPFEYGLMGHSDADVLTHSITDAIIGAAGLGDIGKLFPDTDPKWKDADSVAMLKTVINMVTTIGFVVEWIDSVVITEIPKISPHVENMKAAISKSGIPARSINIKAKTNEKMGFIGRGEGIAAMATCVISTHKK
ncbi:MAG: 2-C-methyl-D-erythritol 2,4-cyclodiphosphate synthase [Nitrospirae bacterium]|nr:2-C-methyl-D-erythritol 2,4-cyclodiphosphate synthase [Nitrospirota bacterium]MBF0534025.1 2-C-methyl-D-erythritol 2,4-cyclodiphosphate synthase [Nitrospirota bacterium]MBF0616184.1 2-C-methyl-D-erythritol 2,4-cyclodiphosphate synthase [Nitrospirota bacterium]